MKTVFSFLVLTIATLILITVARAEFISYTYDTAGRLTGANYGSGKTTGYQYDVSGNLKLSQNSVITDSDNDGMADSWESSFFLTLARDGTGDFDNDGMSDLAEFLAGTLPNNPGSLLRMDRVTNSVVQTTISWLSVSGKTYRVQYKNQLAEPGWNDLPGDVLASGATSIKVDTTSISQSQRFYRTQVVP